MYREVNFATTGGKTKVFSMISFHPVFEGLILGLI